MPGYEKQCAVCGELFIGQRMTKRCEACRPLPEGKRTKRGAQVLDAHHRKADDEDHEDRDSEGSYSQRLQRGFDMLEGETED